MSDLETRADIDALMRSFYQRAVSDSEIGYIFTDVARLDLEKHLPVIGDFWENLLLGANVYQRHGRNPLAIHAELSKKSTLTREHFRRWLQIFREVVDDSFIGPRAEFAKTRAEAIANRMKNYIGSVPDLTVITKENP